MISLQDYRVVEIAVRQCRNSGIDCKVHGVSIVGKLKVDDDDAAVGFSFLAQEDDYQAQAQRTTKKIIPSESAEGQVRVFVWGLNDKDQLGGLKGSKVSTEEQTKGFLNCSYI